MVLARSPDQKRALDSLQGRVLDELRGRIHSIVLFGSVARGEARPDSDIDLLIIIDGRIETKRRIYDISYDNDQECKSFTQTIFFTPQGFESEVAMRSWFSSDIIGQGVVIYDDGTFRRICEEAVPTVP